MDNHMREPSVFETEAVAWLSRASGAISSHDRFVLIAFCFAFIPVPTAPVVAILLSLVQLRFVANGKLPGRERPLLVAALIIGSINLAAWLTGAYVLYRRGALQDVIALVRDAHLYPIWWLGKLLASLFGRSSRSVGASAG
jgi:hypothetical protein